MLGHPAMEYSSGLGRASPAARRNPTCAAHVVLDENRASLSLIRLRVYGPTVKPSGPESGPDEDKVMSRGVGMKSAAGSHPN